MGYYTSPTPVSFAPITITPPDLTAVGGQIGGIMRRKAIASILQNTTRYPGESDADFAARQNEVKTANPQGQVESDDSFDNKITDYVNQGKTTLTNPDAYASANTSANMNNILNGINPTLLSSDKYASNVPLTADQNNLAPIDASEATNNDTFHTAAPGSVSTLDKIPAPMRMPAESNDAYNARIASSMSPQQQAEPLSSYYNRMSKALAMLDQKQAQDYKQQAVQQQFLEDYQKRTAGQPVSNQIIGLGQSQSPFNPEVAATTIKAGADLALTQQTKAQQLVPNIASDLRALAPLPGENDAAYQARVGSDWNSIYGKYGSNPATSQFMQPEPSISNWQSLQVAGGGSQNVNPLSGTLGQLDVLKIQAAAAEKERENINQYNPGNKQAVEEATNNAIAAEKAVINYQTPNTSTPPPATGKEGMAAKLTVNQGNGNGSAIGNGKVNMTDDMKFGLIPVPKAGTNSADNANYTASKQNYDNVMAARKEMLSLNDAMRTSGDKTSNAYKAAEARKTALENPTSSSAIINAYATQEAAKAASNNMPITDKIFSDAKKGIMYKFHLDSENFIPDEQKRSMIKDLLATNNTSLGTVLTQAKSNLTQNYSPAARAAYRNPNLSQDDIINREVAQFSKAITPDTIAAHNFMYGITNGNVIPGAKSSNMDRLNLGIK